MQILREACWTRLGLCRGGNEGIQQNPAGNTGISPRAGLRLHPKHGASLSLSSWQNSRLHSPLATGRHLSPTRIGTRPDVTSTDSMVALN